LPVDFSLKSGGFANITVVTAALGDYDYVRGAIHGVLKEGVGARKGPFGLLDDAVVEIINRLPTSKSTKMHKATKSSGYSKKQVRGAVFQ
jgi:hypothetical protein